MTQTPAMVASPTPTDCARGSPIDDYPSVLTKQEWNWVLEQRLLRGALRPWHSNPVDVRVVKRVVGCGGASAVEDAQRGEVQVDAVLGRNLGGPVVQVGASTGLQELGHFGRRGGGRGRRGGGARRGRRGRHDEDELAFRRWPGQSF